MGTRSAIGFRINGIDKISYNQFDGYPEGVGVKVLEFAISMPERGNTEDLVSALEVVDSASMPSAEQIAKCAPYTDLNVSLESTSDWYCLLRKAQGDLKAILEIGYMLDAHDFLEDSLFCEWAYIINFDNRTFEVYKGFNKDPEAPGRYAKLHKEREGEYFGVALKAIWFFNDLPDEKMFLATLEPEDPETEKEDK